MDDARFDVWMKVLAGGENRRQILRTLTAGVSGLAASWLGFGAIEAKNKRRKRKKRCKRVTDSCTPGGKRKCCNTLMCGRLLGVSGRRCCRGAGASCVSGDECCLDLLCFREAGSARGICGLL